MNRLSRRIATAVAAVAVPVSAALVLPVSTAAAQPCPDVEVVFARGTSEPPGPGRVGQGLADSLRNRLGGRTVGVYGVNYPASYDFLNTATGAADATARISMMAAQCPGTRIVLGGYSQGAAVVDMLAGVPPLGNRIGNIGSAPPLPSGLNSNVAAVAVFGNPSTKFGNPVSATGAFAGKSIDLCADGDPICSDGRNPFAHRNYEGPAFVDQAAGFVAGRV
ncbi:cutinase family protein [Mycobacterium sp. SMC-4]|uniref:cutinase family protein n=1 Tax=Mycobacterium sp. SMC-4 TaxID=2857059 RepID=UPI0037C4F84D